MKFLKYLFGTLSLVFFVIGIIFKILHLSYSNIIISVALGIFGIIFIPIFAIYKYKKKKN